MVDLEADDAPGVVPDPTPADVPESPAPEVAAASAADAPAKLEDLYDFDDPTRLETPKPADTPPAPAAAAAPAASPTAPPAPAISPALQQRASKMGYTPDVIATFKDPIQLEAVVRTAENAATQAMLFARQQMQPQPAAQPQPTLQIPAVPPAPTFDPNAMRADLIARDFAPSLADAMVALQTQNHQTALANHQVAMQQRELLVQRLTEQDKYNQVSQQFMQGYQQQLQQITVQHQKELLDRDYATFSAGLEEPVQKLVSDTANRQNIFNMAMLMANGMASAGQQLPPNPEIFKTAMYAALGDKIHQAATETVRAEVREHQARATKRPAGGGSPPPARNGAGTVDAAARFAEDFFAKHGMPSSGTASFEV